MRNYLLHALACLVCLTAEAKKPNIIVLLVDDMGFSDISCYGGEIPTPNLDRLAASGVKFSQFYNATRCCPTRASLLTGLYAHRAGVGHMDQNQGVPGYAGHLSDKSTTISEVLHDAGYFNILTGKWHVGWEEDAQPWNRKFDRSLCLQKGGLHYSDQEGELGKRTMYLNGEVIEKDDRRLFATPDSQEWYGTRLWTRYGIQFATEAIDNDQPFFWYMPYVAPHFPCMAPEDTITKYRGKYMEGWDEMREARIQRQKELGLIDESWPLSPRDENAPAWDTLSAEEKDRADHIMAIYAAMMDEVDQSVGQIIRFLEERKQLDNTLFIFLSDNGATSEGGVLGKLVSKNGGRLGSGNSSVYVGTCWANFNNTPFRKFKKNSHEGGSATPFIACWPDGFNANPNWISTPAHVIDILPTLADIAGATYPTTRHGQQVFPTDGVSLKPLLAGTGGIEPRPLYWSHSHNAAVRLNDRKLVKLGGGACWELYDMTTDRTETDNLAASCPEEVQHLEQQWNQWANETGVYPKPKAGGKKK